MAPQPHQRATDGALVGAAICGDRSAFDVLVQRHQRRATALAYGLLGNTDDAQEVVQESFLRAYRKLTSLSSPERFGAWMARIVSNQALNFRRGRALRRMSSLDDRGPADDRDGRASAGPTDGKTVTPDEAASAGELKDAIRRAIGQLPETQRLALVLFSIQKLPQAEVAAILGLSVEAVKWHVFSARKKLKDRFSEYL